LHRLRCRFRFRRYQKTGSSYKQVERSGREGRHRSVVNAQEIKAGQQAAKDGAAGVCAIEESPPGSAPWRGFDPSRDGRQRCAHQNRRRQQTDRGNQSAQEHAWQAVAGNSNIEPVHEWNDHQDQQAADGDAGFDYGEDPQRVVSRIEPQPRKSNTSQTQSTHKRRQQDAKGHCRRANRQLQQLVPHNFVNQCGAAAAGHQ
jgi:hypothetical protein